MKRAISGLTMIVVMALAGASAADADKVKPRPAQTGGAKAAPDDFLLLHEGDYVTVLFRKGAGPGSIRFLSLSDRSRLDTFQQAVGSEKYVFRKEEGWQTYPHAVGGEIVTITLREAAGDSPPWELPGCSDVVVRIENAAILSPYHNDIGGPHVSYEVCGAALDW